MNQIKNQKYFNATPPLRGSEGGVSKELNNPHKKSRTIIHHTANSIFLV